MFNSLLIATAMLLGGSAMPASQITVEPQFVTAPAEMLFQKINADIEAIILENHAAPYWELSIPDVWYKYNHGLIKIYEIEPNHSYLVTYMDGNMDVVLEDGF
jgi:hypothetical protein